MRVLRTSRRPGLSRAARRFGFAAVTLLILLIGTRGTQDAVANGDTRTLSLYHNHTRESLTVTFRRNGRYDPRALEQLNWFLRDWRRDEPTQMDPRLFDTLWEVHRMVGSSEAIHVNSAYRSPNTNAMLRRRSRGVAKNSQHMRGKAIDFYLPDVSIERLRAVGMRLQDGGVGYYPNAYTPFVHLDVGSVRAWPRMTRDQLVRLFPDGKTVHIPADGEPLPRYEEAKAEVLAKGGTVAGYAAYADAEEAAVAAPRRKGFWATLFGWADEDEDAEEARVRPSRALVAARPTPAPQPFSESSDNSGMGVPDLAPAPVQAVRPVQVARVESPLPLSRFAGPPAIVQSPSAPRLEWQQGPASLPMGGRSVAGLAFAPMPPRRPEDTVVTAALAGVPLPPPRPGAPAAPPVLLAAVAAESGAAPTRGSDHPVPPPRPGARAVAIAAAGPAAAQSDPAPSSSSSGLNDGRLQLRMLIADATITPPAQARPPEPRPAQPTGGARSDSVVAGLFSNAPMGDLSTSQFTAQPAKPVAVLR